MEKLPSCRQDPFLDPERADQRIPPFESFHVTIVTLVGELGEHLIGLKCVLKGSLLTRTRKVVGSAAYKSSVLPGPSIGGQDRVLRAARDEFLTSADMSLGVRQLVMESWQRSLSAGVDAEGRYLPPVEEDRDGFLNRRDSHPLSDLMGIIRGLLGDVSSDSENLLAVTDESGRLLWVEGYTSSLRQAATMNFVEGALWDEEHAGTNAPGTSLTVGHPVQIHPNEHYSDPVRSWACAAAPIRDPDSNLLLGSIDLTGNEMVESPYCLALVKAASATCEAEIKSRRNELASRFASIVQREDKKVGSALLDRHGVVIAMSPEGWISGRLGLDAARMSATLPGGNEVPIERLNGNEGYLLRADLSSVVDPEVRIETLGRKEAVVRLMGQEIKLSCRQSEIAVILALNPNGVTAEQVAVFLYGSEVSPVTVRAEMSRLRKLLGSKIVGSKPYRFLYPVSLDFVSLRAQLRQGRITEAIRNYVGPVLGNSDSPYISEERMHLEWELRAAVLNQGDLVSLDRWANGPWARYDVEVFQRIADLYPRGDSMRATALARVDLIRRTYRRD